jgi:putative transposase
MDKLAKAQRIRKKAPVSALHAKITSSRKDQVRKHSAALFEEDGTSFVGNVNASALAEKDTEFPLDAGWSAFRITPQYSAIMPVCGKRPLVTV